MPNIIALGNFIEDKIQNELILRDKLSTMAVAASHNLISRILNNSNEKNLGMEGYPAEFGMYLSIIKANKLHKSLKGEFKFIEPDKSNKELKVLYDEFVKLIKSKNEPTSLMDLYDLFSKQPYGLKKGLIPILLAAFYMTNDGSFALYNTDEQGKEFLITDFDKRICERFIHTPEQLNLSKIKGL